MPFLVKDGELCERCQSLAQYSYMVGSRDDAEVAVIDPRRDIDVYLDWCRQRDARIMFVLETHIHADYASGARALAERTGARNAGMRIQSPDYSTERA